MKKIAKLWAYIGFLAMLMISFFPAIIFIFSNYKSVEALSIYGGIISSLVTLVFIISSNMKKLRNIIISSILNIIFLFTPGTIVYLCLLYGSNSISKSFGEFINTAYISYVLSYTTKDSIFNWMGVTFFSNMISIFLFFLDYKELKKTKRSFL